MIGLEIWNSTEATGSNRIETFNALLLLLTHDSLSLIAARKETASVVNTTCSAMVTDEFVALCNTTAFTSNYI